MTASTPPAPPSIAGLIDDYGKACDKYGVIVSHAANDSDMARVRDARDSARRALDTAIAGLVSDAASLAIRLETAQHLADGLRDRLAAIAAAPPAGPRKPSPGWVADDGGPIAARGPDEYYLGTDRRRLARAWRPHRDQAYAYYTIDLEPASRVRCETLESAQLAAEDALAAVAASITRALGR